MTNIFSSHSEPSIMGNQASVTFFYYCYFLYLSLYYYYFWNNIYFQANKEKEKEKPDINGINIPKVQIQFQPLTSLQSLQYYSVLYLTQKKYRINYQTKVQTPRKKLALFWSHTNLRRLSFAKLLIPSLLAASKPAIKSKLVGSQLKRAIGQTVLQADPN